MLAIALPYLTFVVALVVGGVVSPIPEEATLASAGLAVRLGALSMLPTVVLGIAGVVLGDVAFFALGRGARLVSRAPSKAMRTRAHRLIERWGAGAIVVARFVPGVRSAVFFVAGATGISARRVLLVDLAAALVHVPVLLALGGILHA